MQTNCLTSNSLTRNVGEVLGVFGDSETYQDSSGRWRVRSTAKVKNLYALEEALDWVESPKWSPKFPAAHGKPGRGRQSVRHLLPGLSRPAVSRQVQRAVGHRRRELERHGTLRAIWPTTSSSERLPWPDPIRVEGHQGRRSKRWAPTTSSSRLTRGSRYTLNPRATEILDGKMRDGILATLREKVGGLASLLAARLAELEGRDITFTGQAIVNAEFDKLRNAQLTSTNPLRKPDGSVMTLILLAGSTASAVDSYFLDAYPDRETAASERDKFALLPGTAAAPDAGADGRLPGSPAQWHRVHRALWPQRRLADARVGPLPRNAAREFLGGPQRVRSPPRWASTSRRAKRSAARRTALPRASS